MSSVHRRVTGIHAEAPSAVVAVLFLLCSVQDSPVPYSAGMLSYASYFQIPPRKKSHMVLNHCCYRGFQPLQSFAVRVHTHTMGKKVFMNRAPATPNGKQLGYRLGSSHNSTQGQQVDSTHRAAVVV